MQYTVYTFQVSPLIPGNDLVIASLSELAFDSFQETEEGVEAYVPSHLDNEELQNALLELTIEDVTIHFSKKEMEDINWNAEWESQFDPIDVDNLCRVRAPFHEAKAGVLDLIIEPKMSFGTGHHATTYLVLQKMFELDFKDKEVIDMGSGTAVLAIAAEKLGAKKVWAIDIDEWAYENAIENLERNNCSKIEALLGVEDLLEGKTADIFIANINRNILLAQAKHYENSTQSGAPLLLSGFYENDVPALLEAFSAFEWKETRVRDEWTMLFLVRK
jgi:ribosomal protein L11 methyltransferase